jgi:hypothetical protein
VLARAAQVGRGLVLAGGVINSMALPAAADAVSTVDSYLSIGYNYTQISPTAGYAAFTYYDSTTGNFTNIYSTIWLTDAGVTSTQPSNSTPYVTITPTSTSGMTGTLTLTFNQVSGASAAYGLGSESDADTSLVADTATPVSVAAGTEVSVTIGT